MELQDLIKQVQALPAADKAAVLDALNTETKEDAAPINAGDDGYYDTKYFEWQRQMGAFGGVVELFKFQPHIKSTDRVIDFGCGGGYLLKNLQCADKLGLEINPNARKQAAEQGINTVDKVKDIPDDWADVIISNHALEHTFRPLDEIKSLYPKLKKGGKIIFCTPLEKRSPFVEHDVNQHLYTWSEMNLGNLFTLAGYRVISSKEMKYKWPPRFWQLRKTFGPAIFNVLATLWAYYKGGISQVVLVAVKD